MKFIIFLLFFFTINANASEYSTKPIATFDTDLTKLENNYKKLIISAVNNKLKNTTKTIDPKYLELLASCHLAGTTAWPPNLRLQMLTTYNKSTNISAAMGAFEKQLDNLILSKSLPQKTMFKYVNLQSVIYDGCAKHINTDFWRNKLIKNGTVDYYP